MRVRAMFAVALLSVIPGAGVSSAEAATACPSECRREVAQVLCSTLEIVTGDTRTIIRYYWSS